MIESTLNILKLVNTKLAELVKQNILLLSYSNLMPNSRCVSIGNRTHESIEHTDYDRSETVEEHLYKTPNQCRYRNFTHSRRTFVCRWNQGCTDIDGNAPKGSLKASGKCVSTYQVTHCGIEFSMFECCGQTDRQRHRQT